MNHVANGQMKYINKCEGTFNTDNGCPCNPSTTSTSGPVPPVLLNWPAFIVGQDPNTDYNISYAVAMGSVYVTGFFTGTIHLYNGGTPDTTSEPPVITLVGSGASIFDAFVASYSATGQVQWATIIRTNTGNATQGFAIKTTATNVFVCGLYDGEAEFFNAVTSGTFQPAAGMGQERLNTLVYAPPAPSTPVASTTSISQFTAAFDIATGQVNWVTKVDNIINVLSSIPIAGDGLLFDMAINEVDGYIYVSGYFRNTLYIYSPGTSLPTNPYANDSLTSISNNCDMFLIQYDIAGNFQWAGQTYSQNNTSYSFGTGIACDRDNVYVTGAFKDNVNYLKTTTEGLTAIGTLPGFALVGSGYGMFMLAYTTNGAFSWVSQGVTSANVPCMGESITLDATGVYTSFIYSDTVTIYSGENPGPPTITPIGLSPTGAQTYLIVKYNLLTGAIIWIQQIQNTTSTALWGLGASLSTDGSGVYLTSSYDGQLSLFNTAQYQPGSFGTPISVNNFSGAGMSFFLVKYDTQGTIQWITGGAGNNTTGFYGHGVDTDGTTVYLTGFGNGLINFYNANGTNVSTNVAFTFNPSPSIAPYSYVVKYNTSGQLID